MPARDRSSIEGRKAQDTSSDGTRPTPPASILNPTRGNNGGLTHTHALVPASPAIDAVSTGGPLQKTDQRGVPRPLDGNNDGTAQSVPSNWCVPAP
ncbi:MAG: choice-of-anchor Q domain-containing protein [Gammaproteobacteria bacterium]